MNRSERVPEGFRKGSATVREPLIWGIAHTCTCTYTCNSTISTPSPVTAPAPSTSRRAAPCMRAYVDPEAHVTVMGSRDGNGEWESEPRDPADVIAAHTTTKGAA